MTLMERRRGMAMMKGDDDLKYEVHEIVFTITAKTDYPEILNKYIRECADFCYFPVDGNTNLNTVCHGTIWPPNTKIEPTGSSAGNTAFPNGVRMPREYNVNDQTYNVVRERGNIKELPAGTYKLKFYGIAKE